MSATSILPSSTEWSMLSLAGKDPFSTYEELRKRGPIIWDPGMKCWLVLSYELCKTIESDELNFRPLAIGRPEIYYEIKGGTHQLSNLQGDAHTRMRRFVLKFLGPSLMARYRVEHVLPVINHLIDQFEGAGRAELVAQLAHEVPNRVMGSLFGLPWKDDEVMANIGNCHKALTAWIGMKGDGEELTRKAKAASDYLNNLYLPLALDRQKNRGNDAISDIWTFAERDWDEFDISHVMAAVRELELGAGDTTTNAIANAVYLFLSEPKMREVVTSDQEGTLNAFVEETLRLLGSVQWRFRRANQDITLGGQLVKKDQDICLLHAASNRDPDHYSCPHAIDLNRKPATDHLAFNVGPRICLGMHLARLMIRECLKVLIKRLPNLRLDPEAEAPTFRDFSHRSYGPLHVLF